MSSNASNLAWLNLCQQLASVIGFPVYVIARVIYDPCVRLVCTEAWPGFQVLVSACAALFQAAAGNTLHIQHRSGCSTKVQPVIVGFLLLLMVSFFMLGGMWQVPSVN